jgi:hypothetical protein
MPDVRIASYGQDQSSRNERTIVMHQTNKPIVSLRVAHADESEVVRWIAQLDDSPAPSEPVLLALVDGEAVAARSLSDGRVVANPFRRTADAVALLDIRAAQLSEPTELERARARRRIGRLSRLPAA